MHRHSSSIFLFLFTIKFMKDTYMRTPIIIVAVGLIGLGLLLWSGSAKKERTGNDLNGVAAVTGAVWTKGNPDAKVVLTEFADFQCPACAAYEPIIHKIAEKYGGQLKLEFRHFPLPMHPNAISAARAAEAAGAQGKFWEMHDLLYAKQTEWSNSATAKDVFTGYAGSLGLDVAKFTADASSDELAGHVVADTKLGDSLNVNYTPYLLLNGKRLENPKTEDEFIATIEKALADAGTPYVPSTPAPAQ